MRSIKDIFRSYAELDSEGRHVNGTDKESNHHYGDAYESLFPRIVGEPTADLRFGDISAPTREQVRLMMEVGVADGASLLAWREIFPNALCVGLDIHHSDRAHGERIEFHLGDQRKQADCERAAGGRLFDLIVDDATHQIDATLLTLFWLWPFVRPGGLYVIEEFPNTFASPELFRTNICAIWPCAVIMGTCGPHVADEPLVVLRKPL